MKNKIGVYVCECGPNIADNVDIDKIIETISSLDQSEYVEIIVKKYGLLCSVEGKKYIEEEINENDFTHLVIAACSPRDHNNTFIDICKKTKLNPYLYKMINIREHCAWIIHDKEKATQKAIQYIRAGIQRVLYQSELFEKQLDSNPDVLIIGGGIAGIEAALSLASHDRKIYLIEKSGELGGKAVHFSKLLPRQTGGAEYIKHQVEAATNNENIRVFTNAEIKSVIGFLGNYEVVVGNNEDSEQDRELKMGAIIVATGYQLSKPADFTDYKFKKKDEVYTSLEIEKMIRQNGKMLLSSGKQPQSVALIYCAGRTEKGYCSGICCNTMLKMAQYFKEQSSDMKVMAFVKDLCLPHKEDQKYFKETETLGVDFIRIKEIELKGTEVKYTEINDKAGETSFDMVVIAPAMEPTAGTKELAELLDIPLNETGFFQEAHHSINPVATSTDGIYIVGSAHGPKGISDSIMQAQAAAGKILSQLIIGEKIIPEVRVSEILEAFCMGCKTCLEVCSYGAINYHERKGISIVNEAVCRGCGNCVGSCPSGAIRLKHFTNPQLYQEVFAALK